MKNIISYDTAISPGVYDAGYPDLCMSNVNATHRGGRTSIKVTNLRQKCGGPIMVSFRYFVPIIVSSRTMVSSISSSSLARVTSAT